MIRHMTPLTENIPKDPPLPLTSVVNSLTQQHSAKSGSVLLPSPGVTHESV